MTLAMPLLEAALSIGRRILRRQPVFGADQGHIHHRLLAQGFTPRRAALVLYAGCGAAAAFSLLQDIVSNQFGGLILVLFCGVAWIGIQHLGYAEFGLAGRFLLRGTLRGMIDVQVRLQQFERALAAAQGPDQLWDSLRKGSEEFGFSMVRLKFGSRVFEHWADPAEAREPLIQLRIPLPDGQYVNFSRRLDAPMHPITMTVYAQIVQRVLVSRIPNLVS
jgi:UDP-GlcNAc:undecaprenyl-phosphate GlcNAc-1-phosphate transferase